MILKRFYDEKLAQASYLVACAATGEALVVDPNRNVDAYLRAAERDGLRIAHVTETHIHADFVSGSRELASRTGARLYLSDEGGPDWRYAFAREAGARLLKHGDQFRVGNVRLDVLHTPGHTPEHLSFLITDAAAADRPMGVFTGDFVFVGDVGRPDLLERAAGIQGTMRDAARRLHRSLQRFKQLPDYLQLWPAHGAGSACGKSLGAVPQSTLGYEKLFNWAFGVEDEEAFVEKILQGQPDPPRYFAEMKRVNRDGPPILGSYRRPDRLPPEQLSALLDAGVLVIDARSAAEHARRRVPGTLNIPLVRTFSTWAGWLVPYERDYYILMDGGDGDRVDEAAHDLFGIGLDRLAGWFGADAVQAWSSAGRALERIPYVSPSRLAERLQAGEVDVVDVRSTEEWASAHIRGAKHIPLGHLPVRLDELPAGRPLVVHCQSGARSAIAVSLLKQRGYTDVMNLAGGFAAWMAAGQPVDREEESRAA
jgi:hydroxyacylglutathione hydrolase